MKKTITIILSSIFLTSCVNQMDRLSDAQKKYPKCVITPPTSLFLGYDAMVEDTISNQIYILDYYPLSSTRIRQIRNVK
jgi:PBP1b-binding outer membrane lipoprotein LpoB